VTAEPKIAGGLITRNYSRFPGTFPVLKQMSDVTIVIDDSPGSAIPDIGADETVSLRRKGEWNDTANQVLLFLRAAVHGCNWVIGCGDDMLPSVALFNGIRALSKTDADMVWVEFRELWEGIDQYRSDGIWGTKGAPALVRNWMLEQRITLPDLTMRLHRRAWNEDRKAAHTKADAKYAVYHFGSLTRALREARVEKYRRADPTNRFQRDYSYMLDDSGIQLSKVPREDQGAMLEWIGGSANPIKA